MPGGEHDDAEGDAPRTLLDILASLDGMRAAALPLSELLPRIVTPGGALVVISGLDYDSLRLTPQSQIRKL